MKNILYDKEKISKNKIPQMYPKIKNNKNNKNAFKEAPNGENKSR